MAAPVIESVVPASVALTPGASVDVVITASDPDQASGTGVIPVTDGQGNTTPVNVAITVTDPLTFGTATDDVLGVTVTKVAETATTATYRFTAA